MEANTACLAVSVLALCAAMVASWCGPALADPFDVPMPGPESILDHGQPHEMADNTFGCGNHFYRADGCPSCGAKTPGPR
ncbi:hypothetical protein [uncultured Ramlibacter sp.]|uniref:hypothetical protein n=1 Tax=uncultured Ramlibacter sp. TaxID=260755 RepID=UPI00260EDF7C|nr:hypothetical protein [uncultured Ramlibacter sp.]